jgi:sporulation protein YlmC with PRC-barrel domain
LSLPAVALAQSNDKMPSANAGTSAGNAQPAAADAHFKSFDTNNDGYVSRQEFMARQGLVAAVAQSTPSKQANRAGSTNALNGNFYASNLIGMGVRNNAGRDVGEIEDLLVDVDSGNVRAAIVSFGGIADMGDKLYRYPLSSFTERPNSDALILDVNDDSVRKANGFDRSNWNFGTSGNNSTYRQGVWQASRLLGRDIEDRNDDHLGEIKDLLIDGHSGRVQSVIMRYDRPWSLDNPLVTVPLHSLRFAGDKQTVSMNVDRNDVDTQRTAGGTSSPDFYVERWFVLLPDNNKSATSSAGSAAAANAGNKQASGANASEFNRLDTNGDGTLSQAEYDAGAGTLPEFGKADKDANSSVSRDEFTSTKTSQLKQ